MRSRWQQFLAGVRATPKWLLLAGVLALAFYCVNALHYGKLPLRIEESEWPPMAKAIFESGKPVIEADDSHRVRFNEDLTVDSTPFIGAWHPPLYLYTVAASMTVVGTHSSYLLRGVGAAGLLVAAILLLLIAREVTPRWRLIGGVAAILLLIHPYAIQGSLFLDIDNSIYATAILLPIWAAIRYGKREGPLTPLQILAIGGAIAVAIWAKVTTIPVVIAALVAWWLLSRRPLGKGLTEAGAFVAVAVVLFFSTYALWCALADIPFSYMFDVTFGGKSNRLLSSWVFVEHAAHWHLRWFGAALVLLGVVYLADLIRNLLATSRLRPFDLPFLVSLGILIQYVLLSPTDGTYQGKYAFPALVTMLLPISWMVLRDHAERRRPALLLGAVVIGLLTALLLPDVLTWLSYMGNYGTWTFELRVAAAAGAALLLAWLIGGTRGFGPGVIAVLAILLIAQGVRSYRVDTSPMYPIPDTADFNAVAFDINHTTKRNEIVIAPKDLGFYIERHVVEGEDTFARGDARTARAIRRYPRITAFARDTFGPPVGPETEALLDRCFRDRREFGTASVAYRTDDCR